MHSSFFNYNLTRPYPYRWFTPVALTGAIALLILLSVMNFVQNSYILVVQYADNPNSTIAHGSWYSHWPSYLTRSVKPTCEPANLPVNTQFFTNQSGLTWTLGSIVQGNSTSTVSPSLPYMNNVLEDCNIYQIQMTFEPSTLVQVQSGQITAAADVQVKAFVTCDLAGPMGYTKLNISAIYDTISPGTIAGTSSFIGSDRKTSASLWWAQALLSAYWIQTTVAASATFSDLSQFTSKGLAILYPGDIQEGIQSLLFFNLTYTMLTTKGNRPLSLTPEVGYLNTVEYYINHNRITPDQPTLLPWPQVDGLAKSMYSAVLADLGQVTAPPTSNIVANSTALQYFTSNFSDTQWLSENSHIPLLNSLSYEATQASNEPSGPLRLTPSVIATKYLCQVPRRKPIGDILISVLLADLVLLQAAWRLYVFIIDTVMMRRQPSAKYCEGCHEDGEELRALAEEVALKQQQAKASAVASKINVRERTRI